MIAIIGLLFGIILGVVFDVNIPERFSPYMSVAFISGFFGNAVLAAALAYLGDKLGIPIYIAAVIVFGGRIFDNFAIIRRLIIEKYKSRQ
ncbi:DUF1290 domain-containing protein [Clostridium sp.]|uniref:DUF1290 domain-containing protein n=1 Tax=Clostridium sp. TaxID=1506 RepID=UPI0029047C5E|nr:DUF1290 domain-containing protein [Clostridium sp.]MDU1031545.1 DUF1290 domain-containing protein [Clostridium sp.]